MGTWHLPFLSNMCVKMDGRGACCGVLVCFFLGKTVFVRGHLSLVSNLVRFSKVVSVHTELEHTPKRNLYQRAA